MLLKTYRGSDLASALRQVRQELGPDALVLGTSEQKRRFGLSVVEVTVAAPRQVQESNVSSDPAVAQLAAQVRDLRAALQLAHNVGEEKSSPPAASPAPAKPPRVLDAAIRRLVASGLDPDLAQRFGRITCGDSRGLAADLTEELGRLIQFAPLPTRRDCLFLVGPPGSGKTTTAAKLASRVCAADRPVVFAVADNERIGGFEQAEIYSRHIGSRVARVTGPKDLRRELAQLGAGEMILVDTCGIGAGDRDRMHSLIDLRGEAPTADLAMLLPAGLNHSDALGVIDRFEPLQPTCVGLSRVDDSIRPGELITALARRNLPLSFVTDGHAVPDALEPASAQSLAALLLRSGDTGRATEIVS